ncbi:hypothetical protein Q604_UNBC17923G0001, partial [human gut metagenome]
MNKKLFLIDSFNQLRIIEMNTKDIFFIFAYLSIEDIFHSIKFIISIFCLFILK